jgi:glycosyltransferase involved in cell wall biosynthesis
MVKVVHLTTAHPAYGTRIFYKECQSLKQAGYDVVLIAQCDKDRLENGILIKTLPKPKNRFIRMFSLQWQAYKLAKQENAEVYHFHDHELLVSALILFFKGYTVVFDMHENQLKTLLNKPWINPIIRKMLARLSGRLLELILRPIPVIFAEKSYQNYFPRVKQHCTVLNLPLLAELNLAGNHNPKFPKFSIGYIGRIAEDRGLLVSLNALQILLDKGYDINYHLIGLVDEHLSDILESFLNQYPHHIFYHGYQPAQLGYAIMSQCHAALALYKPNPDNREIYPTKLFEYMGLKLPIIASDLPLIKELAADCGILVDFFDEEAIANAISWVLAHPIEAEKMGIEGKNKVDTQFSWQTEEKKLVSFYQTLIQQ